MKIKHTETIKKSKTAFMDEPLRLWPGVLFAAVLILIRYFLPVLVPRATAIGIFGGMLLSFAIFIWWFFFSRTQKIEKWGAFLLIVMSITITWLLIDKSIATANMGMMFPMFSIPVLSIAFVAWAFLTRTMPSNIRRISMVLTIIIAVGSWILLRTDLSPFKKATTTLVSRWIIRNLPLARNSDAAPGLFSRERI